MSFLLQATLRGSIAFALVWGIDRWIGARMRATRRRLWWWLIPVAFLLPTQFPFRVPIPIPAGFAQEFDLGTDSPDSSANPMHENPGASPAKSYGATALSVLPAIWIAGTLAYGLLLIGRSWSVSRRWARARPSSASDLLDLLEDCKAEMGVTSAVGLIVSPDLRNPALLGWYQPRILLPEALATRLSRSQLRIIFLHELTHIRSRDVPMNWLFSAAAAFHWFNPLAYLAVASWRQFQEEVADETAIARSNDPSGQVYGEVLLEALAVRQGQTIPFGALCLGEPIKNLKRRFHMIRRYAHKTPHSLLFCSVAVLLVAVIFLRPIRAEDAATASLSKYTRVLAEQQQPRHLVPFDPVHFDKYIGYYELSPTLVFKISRDGDRFFTQLTGQGPVEVYPESETKFFATVVAAQISFVIDSQGGSDELVLHQGGLEQHAKRIDEATAKNLAAAFEKRIASNTPSPGTEAFLRRFLDSQVAGKPDFSEMSSALAEAARAQQARMFQDIKKLGALVSIKFTGVSKQGLDNYIATFEHGGIRATVAPPSPDGKVSGLLLRPTAGPEASARIKANQPSPGTEESVRKWLSALEAGQPDYDDMTPDLAAAARDQWPNTSKVIKKFGPLKNIRFTHVNQDGADVYQAEFENSTIDVFVSPLTADGKVAGRYWRILTAKP